MLNKLLSSFGIQGVQVDTILYASHLQAGQNLAGEIHFKGAQSDKSINGIYLQLMTTAEVESGDTEFQQSLCIAQWHVSGAFELKANQVHQFPIHLQLPYETPITEVQCHRNSTRVWLHTHLDIDWGIDATDKDFLQIQPTTCMQNFLIAMQQCGFNLFSVDVEKGQLRGNGFHSTIGCYQELEFRPNRSLSGINEVEVSFVAEADRTHVLLEVDRTFRGDGFKSMTIPHHLAFVPNIANEIKRLLSL